jgi:hypothetical protein
MMRLIKRLNNHLDNEPLSTGKYCLTEYKDDTWKTYIPVCEFSNYYKKRIFSCAKYEIFLIFWNKKAKAKIHDHAENGCLMKILQGSLKEINYEPDNISLINSKIMNENDVSYIDNSLRYHAVENNSDMMAVSMHIYSPPDSKTLYYN